MNPVIELSQFKNLNRMLDKILRYNLYYTLTYLLYYLVLDFFNQINKNDEIRTRDRLINKALIPC